MRTLVLSITLTLASWNLGAQGLAPEVVASAGELYTSSSLQVEWTLGELMTETYTGSVVLTQGFHQPALQVTSIDDFAAALGPIKVYPNPVAGRLTIEQEKSQPLLGILFDLQGRVLLQQALSMTSHTLDLSHLPAGMYVLRLSDGQRAVRSFRIEKL
ncbi:MAG: T9SS type A sorting domain-containing protein [Bacteroidota bacterium]